MYRAIESYAGPSLVDPVAEVPVCDPPLPRLSAGKAKARRIFPARSHGPRTKPFQPGSAARPPVTAGRLCEIHPDFRVPTPAEMQALGEANRFVLERFLAEKFEYLDHPTFHEPGAEERLFGKRAVLAAGATYFAEEPALVMPARGRSVLAADEERLLFERFNYARLRAARIALSCTGRRMPRGKLRELLAWLNRALMLRGQITQANIALVITMAGRIRVGGLDFNEITSAGNLALLRSVDRFDCFRGYKFSTYACQGILQRMLHAVEGAQRYRTRFSAEFDESFERDDASARHHQTAEQDYLDDLHEVLEQNRAELTETERFIIKRRFAIGQDPDAKPMTLKEIGQIMGMTKERVRQLEKRALQKLRCTLMQDGVAA